MTTAVIVDIVRTASGKGKPGGALSGVHPVDLLAQTLTALVERNGLDPALVDDVIAGCVSQVGEQSLNIARTALLAAGFPESVPATTVDRQCGSSQQAAHFAAQGVIAGAYDIVIACGVESMSRVPMGSSRAGRNPVEPLAARYPEGLANQGISAELIAARWKLDREALDEFSARSHARAAAAAASGGFANEIVGVRLPDGGTAHGRRDDPAEHHRRGTRRAEARLLHRGLRRALPRDRLDITPGNSSPLTDGASAVLIMSEEKAAELGLRPRARFHSFAVTGNDPLLMLTGVIPATAKVLAAQRPDHRRHRRLRGQRGVRAGAAGLGAGVRRRPGQAQPARRRDRPRPPARRLRHPAADHAAELPRGHRRPLRPADDVRGRRDGQRHHHRAALTVPAAGAR